MSTRRSRVSQSDRNATRRLNTILANEDFGPKLARLNRDDERKVLDLIDQNRGREARELIIELDVKRREKISTARRVREYLKLPEGRRRKGAEHPTDESTLFWRIYDQRVA